VTPDRPPSALHSKGLVLRALARHANRLADLGDKIAAARIKTDRRDAVMLAKLHRAGELTAVWVPDAAHEAMRDLIRARATAVRLLGKARQHLQGFLLRHGRVYAGKKGWTLPYRRWLTTVRFDKSAQQIVLQDYIHAVHDAEERVARLTKQIEELAPTWSMAPVVEAFQAMLSNDSRN
jgi:transposase